MNTTDEVKDAQVKPARRRRSCLGCLGRAALGVLVFLVIVVVAGAIYQAAASASDAKKYPPPGQLYDMGDYKLHLYCTGEGSPTVILEAGAGSPSLSWFLVQEKVAEFTRVCSYDRAGFGWSEPSSGPLSSDQVAADLHGLLKTAGVPGPYILVGHSAGGPYIRAYASQYPAEVLGMVLVDSSHESQNLRFPAKFQEYSQRQNSMMKLCQYFSPFGVIRLSKLWHTMIPETITSSDLGAAVMSTMYRTSYCRSSNDEISAISEAFSQPEGPASLGDMPLIVLSAGASFKEMPEAIVKAIGADVLAEMEMISQELQQELVGLSTQGKQVIAEESSHYIQWDQPNLVIDAIRTIVERVHGEE
jgi:pimeloyl-ACP methyl ester carboxylesterase